MALEELNALSDKEILAKIKAGQEDLFVILYDRHAAAAYRHILFRSEDPAVAEDVVSQAFLQIWDHLRNGKPIRAFRAFLFQSARNIFVDLTRKREFKNLSLEEIVEQDGREPAGANDVHEKAMLNDEIQALKRAIANLPEHYREILILRYLNELTIPEIVQVTGKNSGAVYVSLHRGTRLLRQALVEARPPTHR